VRPVPRTSFVLVLGLAVLMALGTAACGSDVSSLSDAEREKRYSRVLEESSPSVEDVIEIAGAPSAVYRADDGSLLVTYNPSYLEDDEGPAAFAWRLFGPDGKRVAEHAQHADAEFSPGEFFAVSDGFVCNPDSEDGYLLDVWGKKHSLRHSSARTTKRGDAWVEVATGPSAYRPSTREVAPIAGVPNPHGEVTLDDQGTTWRVDSHVVVRSRDGRNETQRLPDGYEGAKVAANGGTAVVSLVPATSGQESVKETALFVSSDGGGTWTTLKDEAPPVIQKDSLEYELDVLADGRILAGAGGKHSWLGTDSSNRSFRQIEHPVAFTSVRPLGDTLYGIADSSPPSYALVEGEGLWTSKNGGRSWSRFDDRKSG
jgi:hypothetical protein